jgi:predicted amidohydrolase YtcJ
MKQRFVLLAIWLLIACACAHSQTPSADVVLLNGRIITSDPLRPTAQALAIRQDRILAVGSTQEIERLATPPTRKIDLKGRTVIPGFNDAHYHFSPQAPGHRLKFEAMDPSRADMATALARTVASAPAGEWIFGAVGPSVVLDTTIDRAALDALSPQHPVLLQAYYGHGYIANSLALSHLKISDEQADPAGGHFERIGTSRRINGRFWEYAQWTPARWLANQASEEGALAALRAMNADAVRFGITSMQVFSTLRIDRFAELLRKADLDIRVRAIPFALTSATGRDVTEIGALASLPASGSKLTFSGVKWVLDGTPFERGAALRKDYSDRSGWRGAMNFPRHEIDAMIGETIGANQQLLVHAVGDKTIEEVLAAMERSKIPAESWPAKRLRIEHGDGLESDLVARARTLGIVVVQNPTHFADAELFARRWGTGRQPLRSLLEAGVHVAIGSDGAMNPFLNIMFAVTHPANPREALSRAQALQAYTLGAAFAEFSEQQKGSISVGKLADIAVLSQDPLAAPIAALPSLHSVLTIVGGRVVHEIAW